MPEIPKQFAINPASLYKEWNFAPDKVDQGEAVQAPAGRGGANEWFGHLLPATIEARAESRQDPAAPDAAGAWVAVRGVSWEPGSTVHLTMVGISYKQGPYLVGEAHPEGGAGAFQTGFFTHAQPTAPEQQTPILLIAEGGGERAQAPIPFFAFYTHP